MYLHLQRDVLMLLLLLLLLLEVPGLGRCKIAACKEVNLFYIFGFAKRCFNVVIVVGIPRVGLMYDSCLQRGEYI